MQISQSLPNLFILGAPKCGTTALANWLSAHPEVYGPPSKEPHHFSSEYCLTPDPADYAALYHAWEVKERWAFDASVWSLFSSSAVPNILKLRPDARFIVMLRNPLQMIPSMHRQQIFNGNELERDLRSALAFNDRRAAGERLSVLKGYPSDHLAYYHSCALGWQVNRLLARVDNDKLHIVLYDDLNKSAERMLSGVYEFLDVDPFMPAAFKKVNAAKVRVSPLLDRAVKSLGDWKHRRGFKRQYGILSWLRRVNRQEKKIPALSEKLKNEIRERMAQDLDCLSHCIGRDLSHWFRSPGRKG